MAISDSDSDTEITKTEKVSNIIYGKAFDKPEHPVYPKSILKNGGSEKKE